MSDSGSILVIRLSSLGDVLLCAPALRAVRARFPESQIHFLVATEFEEAARLLPEIDHIIILNRKDGWRGLLRLRRLLSRRYDLIVDLQNSYRSAFLRVLCFPLMWVKASRFRFRRSLLIRFKKNFYGSAKPVALRYVAAVETLGAKDDGLGLNLRIPDEPVQDSRSPCAVLCPGAKHETKRWPIENWVELAAMMKAAGVVPIVCGSAAERDLCLRVAGSGEVMIEAPLVQIAQVMRSARVVVCNDSGLMHLAAGANAKTVAIFGPTVEEFGFFPFRANASVLQQNLACRPCAAFGGKACPLEHHNCMKLTTTEDVVRAAQVYLRDSRP